ncbi:MAG: glycosyltransferase family 4 protein [Cyclobacteriaceae bacterium]|nr:glycosyltransferase family 4 protein [Cyclobacteriaceae bacterium]
MKKMRMVYIVSNVQKSVAFETTALALKPKYALTFLLLNPAGSELQDFLEQNDIPVKHIIYRGKRDLVFAFFKVFFFLLVNRPRVVHAHLFDAQLVGLSAAWLAGIRMRIYTRHTSNFHHIYHKKGIKYDRLSNRLATQIISISQATDVTLLQLESVPAFKVFKIPHGFDLKQFGNVPQNRVDAMRAKWKIPVHQPVIGVVARFIEWKGIQFIIPAFKAFLKEYPDACLVLCNATGPYKHHLDLLLKDVPVANKVIVPFEPDMAALYKLFDIYVHTPVSPLVEAFGQTYVEALASGIPSVFTQSGIAVEFVTHKKHAWVVDFENTESILIGLRELWRDKSLRHELAENGRQVVISRFGMQDMIDSLHKLYNA